jgi:hypothetical protein
MTHPPAVHDWISKVTQAPLAPVAVRKLKVEEITEVLTGVANKQIEYRGTLPRLQCDVYLKFERGDWDKKRITYFHYWLCDGSTMWKIGSGGYIPDLHSTVSDVIYEFPVTGGIFFQSVVTGGIIQAPALGGGGGGSPHSRRPPSTTATPPPSPTLHPSEKAWAPRVVEARGRYVPGSTEKKKKILWELQKKLKSYLEKDPAVEVLLDPKPPRPEPSTREDTADRANENRRRKYAHTKECIAWHLAQLERFEGMEDE